MDRVIQWATTALVGLVLVAGLTMGGFAWGAVEASSPEARLPGVNFSVRGGLYAANLEVVLTSSPAAKIRYTMDGSEPTERSSRYVKPLRIAESAVIKARAFEDGNAGPTFCETYTLRDESLANFSSNLPLVIIETFGREIDRDLVEPASACIIDPGKARATLATPADFQGQIGIHLRGHTSLRYPKRSYLLKTRAADKQPQKVPILGLPAGSDWVLYAPYVDKTLMRDVLGYELSNQMGRYAPRTRFVEVFLNESGGRLSQRHYMGVFVLEEKIRRGKERVAIEKLEPEDTTEPAITGGYIFKKDHTDTVEVGGQNPGGMPNFVGSPNSNREGYPTGPGGFPGDPAGFLPTPGRADPNDAFFQGLNGMLRIPEGFVSIHGGQFLFVEPEPDKITSPQRRWLMRHIQEFESALYGPEFRNPEKGYAAYIDADSFIDHHLLVETTKNIDGFRFSTFFHKDRQGKINMGPIWDWNLSFGNANGKQGYIPEYWYWPQLDDQQYSWFRRLFEDPDFAQKYVDRWGEIRSRQFSKARILARIDELAALLNEAQARNFKRWRILGQQVWPNHYQGRNYSDEIAYLKRWTSQRLDWIDHQFIAAPELSMNVGTNGAPGTFSLQSPEGKIYYTLDGSDPRAPGGAVSEKAVHYDSSVACTPNGVATARVLHDGRWSWPCRAPLQTSTGSH